MIDRGKMEMVGGFPKGARIPGVVLQFCELCDYRDTCRHLNICADLNQLLLLIRSPYAVEDAGAPAADTMPDWMPPLPNQKLESDSTQATPHHPNQLIAEETAGALRKSLEADDPVHAPLWYRGDGEVEAKRALASMMSNAPLSPKQGYWWGNAFKYIWRWWAKNGAQDIDKAIECLQNLRATLP